jgi:hypothetical protein
MMDEHTTKMSCFQKYQTNLSTARISGGGLKEAGILIPLVLIMMPLGPGPVIMKED